MLLSVCAAMGTTQDCRRQIHRELRYQSSMDLDAGTYAAIRYESRLTESLCGLTLKFAHVGSWVACFWAALLISCRERVTGGWMPFCQFPCVPHRPMSGTSPPPA